MSWNQKFMSLALFISEWSKDDSTKVGAVIVNNDNRVVSVGYNGIPQGVYDRTERFQKPEKYGWFEHAERNAIYSSARLGVTTVGCKLFTTHFPCADCARAIIQAGIQEIVYLNEAPNGAKDSESWKKTKNISFEMLTEAKIYIINQPL